MSQNIRIYEALHRKQAAYRVLEIIAANKGITAREIAQALNYPQVRSVQQHIKFLIGLGVIESYGKHYKVARVDDQHLEAIAAQRGTIGCIEKRKAQYAKDRYQYAATVAAYQELRKERSKQRDKQREARRQDPRPSTVKQDPWQPSDWFIPTVRPTPTGGYAYTSP
jgi:SOS-response transcriptional repressor LexA